MNLSGSTYKYVVVGFNGDPSSTGFASRVGAVTAEMTKDGSRALVVRFVPMPHRKRSWKKTWQRSDRVDLLEVPALPISRYAWLRKLSVAISARVLRVIVAWVRPHVVQCECHEAASLGSQLDFEGLLYADLHGAAPEEARYTRLTAGRSDMSMVKWLEEVEARLVRRFDKLIVVSPKMIEHLVKKTGAPLHDKVAVLPIFADESFFKPLRKEHFKRDLDLDGKTVFLYSGGMQRYQCIDETIAWFQALSARIPNAFLLVFTPAPEVARQRVSALMGDLPENIRIASVGHADLADHMSAADFGFVLREPEVLNAVASPTKAVEYLARGVRLICTKNAGSAFDYVERFGSGLIVPLMPTAKGVDRAVVEIDRLLSVEVPVEAVHGQLSRGGYAEVLRKLYGQSALALPSRAERCSTFPLPSPLAPRRPRMIQIPVSTSKEPVVLLDLSPIKSGGGAQLALNFLQAVNDGRFGLRIGLVLVSDAFPFRDRLNGPYLVAVAPSGARARILHEYRQLPKLVRDHGITHIYTFFGPGLPPMQGVRRIVGMAYPTLVYDDSAYWTYLPKGFRLRKQFQNTLRFRRLQSADHLIFETGIMESRARSRGMVRGGTSVLAPTPTAFLASSPVPSLAEHGAVVLFLAGPDPHKNLWCLPGVLDALERENLPVRFLLSIDRETFLAACPSAAAIPAERMDSHFRFLGRLSPDGLQAAYDACNVVANLSDLESFSNNYMEAWLTGRAILSSDRDFARHICGDSALYVEPHDPTSLLAGLRRLARGEVDTEAMVRAGQEALARLPTLDERLQAIAEIIAPGTFAKAPADPVCSFANERALA